jgi:HAD superfamily hydrolase (TIGR01509 family)
MFSLVIFDCDGVLVDSELITNRVFAAMINELGVPVTLEDMFEKFVGHTMAYCCDLITAMSGKPLPEDFVARYRERTTAALHAELRAVRGIEAALDAIDALGLPYCVASSGSHEKMRTTLGITGLWPRMHGKLFSVTEVVNPKPAPDVFLHAARLSGAEPRECCVVEDSPIGVAAGVAAGMTVLGYCALTPKQRLLAAGAHRTFDDMRELPTLLQARAAIRELQGPPHGSSPQVG